MVSFCSTGNDFFIKIYPQTSHDGNIDGSTTVLDSTHQGLSNDVPTNFQLHVEVRMQDAGEANHTHHQILGKV